MQSAHLGPLTQVDEVGDEGTNDALYHQMESQFLYATSVIKDGGDMRCCLFCFHIAVGEVV